MDKKVIQSFIRHFPDHKDELPKATSMTIREKTGYLFAELYDGDRLITCYKLQRSQPPIADWHKKLARKIRATKAKFAPSEFKTAQISTPVNYSHEIEGISCSFNPFNEETSLIGVADDVREFFKEQ
jgi:hypothetical protein